MSYTVIGTCGACGGQVVVPKVWMGIYPPTPQCNSCHREPVNAHGPVLPMRNAVEFRQQPDGMVEIIDHEKGQASWYRTDLNDRNDPWL